MFRFLIVFSLSLMVATLGRAQDSLQFIRPDFGEIKKLTTARKSHFYYQTLLNRYLANDTSLTEGEIHMLYYGKFFSNDDHKAATDFSFRDSIQAMYSKDSTDADRRDLIRYYTQEYQYQPLNLKVLIALLNLHSHFHDDEAAYFFFKLRMLVNVILATGSGLSPEEAIYVNSVPDEYAILSVLELHFGGTQKLIGVCDYLEVAENDYKIEGVYFNVEQLLKGYERMLSKKEKKKMYKQYKKLMEESKTDKAGDK